MDRLSPTARALLCELRVGQLHFPSPNSSKGLLSSALEFGSIALGVSIEIPEVARILSNFYSFQPAAFDRSTSRSVLLFRDPDFEKRLHLVTPWSRYLIEEGEADQLFFAYTSASHCVTAGSWGGICPSASPTERLWETLARIVDLELLRGVGILNPAVLVFHAAVVTLGGCEVALFGPSLSGKTTVANALVGAGWNLISDDVTLWCPVTERFLAFGRRSMQRAQVSYEYGHFDLADGRWLFQLKRGSVPAVWRCSADQTLDIIIGGMSRVGHNTQETGDAIAELMQGARSFTVEALEGDPSSTISLINHALGSCDD